MNLLHIKSSTRFLSYSSKKFPRTSFHIEDNKWKIIKFSNHFGNRDKNDVVADEVIIIPLEKTCLIEIDMGKITTNEIEIHKETEIGVKNNCFYIGENIMRDDVWFFDWVILVRGKFKMVENVVHNHVFN